MKFAEFFRALWKCDPFPWQEEYAKRALEGNWPCVGVPTAAGKTALIDVAVYALAMRAPRAARRIFFVVDRRVIVDEAAERAAAIRAMLRDAAPDSSLGKIAQSLLALGGEAPLETAVLRGGIARTDGWAECPLQPTVICSTVDQIGSSLLFRAYGASEYARPIRAGLAAYDSLILLDEAHTSRAFAQTLELVRKYRSWAEVPIDLLFTTVEMSATPGGDAIRESSRDLVNDVLARRWNAAKRARLVAVEPAQGEGSEAGDFTALAEALAREAKALRDRHDAKVVGVIANRVRTARLAHNALRNEPGCNSILLTGRARPYDRERIWQEWKDKIGLGRPAEPPRPIFVVATQCIEVGANLDFDGLVTEIASIDALEQRFGRLDRDGRHAAARGATHAVIVGQKDQIAKKYVDAVYGSAMPATWAWLEHRVETEVKVEELPAEGKKKPKTRKVRGEFVQMGVRTLREALDATADRELLRTPAISAPVLMPAHMDLLCQTSPEPEISPEPAVYLHGPETGPADVQVVWRADLIGTDPERWPDLVATCPPSSGEMLPVPLYAVRQWLLQSTAAEVADLEGSEPNYRPLGGSMQRPALWWKGVEDSEILKDAEAIRPGMTIVVPADAGGCDEWGWDPEEKEETRDVGDAVRMAIGMPMLRLHERVASQWGYESLASRLRTPDHLEIREAIEAHPPGAGAPRWIVQILDVLRRASSPRWITSPDGNDYCAIVSKSGFDQNDTRASYVGAEILLREHMKNCAARAARFAAELPGTLQRTVVRATESHDVGKADPRFQAWLRGGNPIAPDELIAKSARNGQNRAAVERARKLAGYPAGGRHELLSTAMLLARGSMWGDIDWDLLLHLVSSHHGRCRPFAPMVEDESPCSVDFEGVTVSTEHGLERVGSGVSERFWKLTRRYGWHGLAYLETLVRLADQRESEAEGNKQGKAAHV